MSSNILQAFIDIRKMTRAVKMINTDEPEKAAEQLRTVLHEALAVQMTGNLKAQNNAIQELRSLRGAMLTGQIKAGKNTGRIVGAYSLAIDRMDKEYTKSVNSLKESKKGDYAALNAIADNLPSMDSITSAMISVNPLVGYSVKIMRDIGRDNKEAKFARKEEKQKRLAAIEEQRRLIEEQLTKEEPEQAADKKEKKQPKTDSDFNDKTPSQSMSDEQPKEIIIKPDETQIELNKEMLSSVKTLEESINKLIDISKEYSNITDDSFVNLISINDVMSDKQLKSIEHNTFSMAKEWDTDFSRLIDVSENNKSTQMVRDVSSSRLSTTNQNSEGLKYLRDIEHNTFSMAKEWDDAFERIIDINLDQKETNHANMNNINSHDTKVDQLLERIVDNDKKSSIENTNTSETKSEKLLERIVDLTDDDNKPTKRTRHEAKTEKLLERISDTLEEEAKSDDKQTKLIPYQKPNTEIVPLEDKSTKPQKDDDTTTFLKTLTGTIIGALTGGAGALGAFGIMGGLFGMLKSMGGLASGLLRFGGPLIAFRGLYDFIDGMMGAHEIFEKANVNLTERMSAGFANVATDVMKFADSISEFFGYDLIPDKEFNKIRKQGAIWLAKSFTAIGNAIGSFAYDVVSFFNDVFDKALDLYNTVFNPEPMTPQAQAEQIDKAAKMQKLFTQAGSGGVPYSYNGFSPDQAKTIENAKNGVGEKQDLPESNTGNVKPTDSKTIVQSSASHNAATTDARSQNNSNVSIQSNNKVLINQSPTTSVNNVTHTSTGLSTKNPVGYRKSLIP